ncbi:uncharacterized protein N7515_009757 [Penicillium bovifimosum]|uniref:Uncharacterized protein n=1 Tax=Penicillium bovifimosum TaxID=126998 RepID=A0A9W9KUN2_9EURO|nr:uncharacterized protein N7515_009757 [Penicillium bovifimosum]KAJ5120369.1 hypothetical protein N7515_009757 [Penicillium bovifimosum]
MAIFQSLQRFVRKTREKVGNFLPSRHRRRRESADSQTPLAPSTEGILVRGEIIYPPHRVSLDPEAPRRVSQPLPRQLSRGAQLDKFAAEGEDKSIEMRRTSRPREFVDLTTGNSPTHHRRNSTPTPFPRSPRSPRSPSPDQVPNTPRGIKRRHNLSQEPAESSSAATRQRREVIETIDMTGEGGPTLPLPAPLLPSDLVLQLTLRRPMPCSRTLAQSAWNARRTRQAPFVVCAPVR